MKLSFFILYTIVIVCVLWLNQTTYLRPVGIQSKKLQDGISFDRFNFGIS